MFDFRRITLFCLEKRLSKHKITIFSKNFGGPWLLCPPYGYAYALLQSTHYFLQRRVLASKNLPSKLKKVLDISVKTINWTKGRVVNHSLFKSLCEHPGMERTLLLFHTEVRRRTLALSWESFGPLLRNAKTNKSLSGGTSLSL